MSTPTAPSSALTNADLDRIYQKLLSYAEEEQDYRDKHGYWRTNLYGRLPRSKKRRIIRKWFRSGKTITYTWVPPKTANELSK